MFGAPLRKYQPYGLKTALQPTFENACLSVFRAVQTCTADIIYSGVARVILPPAVQVARALEAIEAHSSPDPGARGGVGPVRRVAPSYNVILQLYGDPDRAS